MVSQSISFIMKYLVFFVLFISTGLAYSARDDLPETDVDSRVNEFIAKYYPLDSWFVYTWTTEAQWIWRVNSEWKSKHRSELCNDDCTATGVLNDYWLPIEPFNEFEKKYKIKKELIICIAWADSHLWRRLKSKNNIGNVGNNDRGQTIHYTTINDWIEAIYRTLNNKYLWHKQTVWSLSPWGWWSKPFYATSPENWRNNVWNCLNTILDPTINEERNFRL